MLVSICICTWNRASLLDQTLTAMRLLRIPDGTDWEVLVVNNLCTDETDQVLARHANHLPIRRLYEEKQGLSHARNCAIAASLGDLILWTDDDVVVDPEWLAEYVEAVRHWPDASFFGGSVEPWFEVEPPRLIRDNLAMLEGPYAIRQLGLENRPLTQSQLPFGANMAFWRSVFEGRSFDARLGACGNDVVQGEETMLMEGLLNEGHQGIWVGTAQVRHFIPSHRITLNYLREWYRWGGKAIIRQGGTVGCKVLFGAPRWAWKQYLVSRLWQFALTFSKGADWLSAFQKAAIAQGIIEESRRLARTSSLATPTRSNIAPSLAANQT